MPPQQVYVHSGMHPQNGMADLETQFHALDMNGPPEHLYDLDNDAGEPTDNDEEGSDEDPVKLFVGQIPKTLSEEDIFPTFDAFGPLKDVAVIRDRLTGLHRGCAFVTYWHGPDAETAQEALHNKFTFPGGRRPAQVKLAEPSVPENKLFIGMLSRKAGETEVRELFEPFGEVREIYMIRNADGTSKCAAFLRYAKREPAVQAIETLNQSIQMEGATRPLIVKFADNKVQRQARQMRNTRRDHVYATMRGPPQFPGYPMPQGLPHQMGVQPQPYPISGYGYGGGNPLPHVHPHHHPHPYMYPHNTQFAGPIPPYPFPTRPQEMISPNSRPREGPAGSNLFVYHLPHDLTDADLATAFNPFGNVISAKVYVDRNTGESKGFGFVSYDSVMSAESAIEQMNGFQIGNKRLKVQHKRVSSMMGIGMSPQDIPHPMPQGMPPPMPHGMMPPQQMQMLMHTMTIPNPGQQFE